MTKRVGARLLHVANGTSTTRTIQASGIPGRLSIWADPLYEGPVPGGLSDEELVVVRARYLASATGQPPGDIENELIGWRGAIEQDDSYDELVLWFEHDLFDQLNLVQVLPWLRRHVAVNKRVSLVCIGSFPGRPTFKGLGELTPAELAPLLESRQPVSDKQYTLAEDVWHAFRQANPEALNELRQRDTSPLPFLAAALKRLLQEYPWANGGLSRSERHFLRMAEAGPTDLRAAFPRMHEGEDAFYITDLSFAGLVASLSNGATPLIAISPGVLIESAVPSGTVTLTDLGRRVLAGQRDRVATCGIDRWLGGVHLVGTSDIWRWDDEHQRMTVM